MPRYMLIIAYELTMLGAVVATVVGIIFESRLPNLNLGAYDTGITEGYIGIVVECHRGAPHCHEFLRNAREVSIEGTFNEVRRTRDGIRSRER